MGRILGFRALGVLDTRIALLCRHSKYCLAEEPTKVLGFRV